ncbi:MAG: hypothetical protein AABX10_02030 [Nanoarchaeota archaeon]
MAEEQQRYSEQVKIDAYSNLCRVMDETRDALRRFSDSPQILQSTDDEDPIIQGELQLNNETRRRALRNLFSAYKTYIDVVPERFHDEKLVKDILDIFK